MYSTSTMIRQLFDRSNPEQFQDYIFGRYQIHKRVLPRRDSFNPYRVLVSETMLQQTQAPRVVEKFIQFIEQYPTLDNLANTDTTTLLKLWKGLGFPRRAINLRTTAQIIIQQYQGLVPSDPTILKTLPGIGLYTSCSIPVFAYNHDQPVVDTNIRRIMMWHFGLDDTVSPKAITDIVSRTLPSGRCNDWFNALMDYGSIVCTSKETGIKPIGKQSTFNGSIRQMRSMILDFILHHPGCTIEEIVGQFNDDRREHALAGLQKDRMIYIQGNKYTIQN